MKVDRNQLKFLLLDTEWSYALYYAFPSRKPQFLSAKQIKEQQFCICAAYKWLHETSKYSVKITDDKKRFKVNKKDDYAVATTLHPLIEEADVIVVHNADFDLKHLNALFRKHKLGPVPEKKVICTLKAARKYFNFAGNDLDSLSKLFGGKGKNQKPDWIKITESDPKEIAIATKYCVNDVSELERVFVEIRPYIRKMPAMKNIGDIDECQACQSKRVHSRGTGFDGVRVYRRIKCSECGHEMKAKYDDKDHKDGKR